MGNYQQLKQSVSNVIKTNGNQEISGAILQNSLLSIISTIGANATFAGIATPTTNPGIPDQNIFYIAYENGIYSNFGGVTLNEEVVIFSNEDGSWKKKQTEIASSKSIEDLKNNTLKNSVSIDSINGKEVSVNISVNKIGTNILYIQTIQGQNIKITINAPNTSRLLGIELSNELSTSGTDKQRLFWGTLKSEKIIETIAEKDYKYLLIELWTDEELSGTFEYKNTQKYALQDDFSEAEKKFDYAYNNIINGINQYSYSDELFNFPENIFESSFSYSATWIGGGHKLLQSDKSIYGISLYVEFNSDDIYNDYSLNEVVVFITDTTPVNGTLLKDMNIIFSQSIHANKKGFYDIRLNEKIKLNKDLYVFAYGVENSLKYTHKTYSENNPFTTDFYFINKAEVFEKTHISAYNTNWILQPTYIYFTDNEIIQKKVSENDKRIVKIEESLNYLSDSVINIVDKEFVFNGKKVKVYQDSFGSFVLRKETFITPLGITLERNAKGGRTLTTPIGTIKQNNPLNENVLEYAINDLVSDDYYAIIIALGTNDLGGVIRGTIQLGEFDSNDTSTLYGALNYAANKCKTVAPSAKVILISPINRVNGWNALAMQKIRTAIRYKAMQNGFSLLDGGTSPFPSSDNDLSKICWNNNDGLHPIIGVGSKMYDMWVICNLI